MGIEMHPLTFWISWTVGANAVAVMSVLQSAISMRETYAEAESLVERNRAVHPRRLRAKIVTMTSKLDGAKMATTGAFSLTLSYRFCSAIATI